MVVEKARLLYETGFSRTRGEAMRCGRVCPMTRRTLPLRALRPIVAGSAGLSKTDAARAVDGVLDAIRDALASGATVRLVGFGTFRVVHRAATMGRYPRTGERIHIPASNQPKFKAGKALKAAVIPSGRARRISFR